MRNRLSLPHWLCCIALLALALAPAWANASSYNIEMILFERYGAGGEAWSTDFGRPNFARAKANLSAGSGGGARLLGAKSMGGVAHTLTKKGARVHAHVRWRQQVPNRNNKSWYRIGNQRIDGLISMSRGRYLHLNADLLLRHQGNAHRIKLNRRMRSGEMHYLDHPKIGIIVIAEKVHATSDRQAAPGSNQQGEQNTRSGEPEPATENSTPRMTPDPS